MENLGQLFETPVNKKLDYAQEAKLVRCAGGTPHKFMLARTSFRQTCARRHKLVKCAAGTPHKFGRETITIQKP